MKVGGFTLIELLAVIGIIAVLAAIIAPKITDAIGKAKRVSCATNMKNIIRAMQLYQDDRNTPLSTNAELDPSTAPVVNHDDVFGRLYYLEPDADGDMKTGITSMAIYNCPDPSESAVLPVPPQHGAYGAPLTTAGAGEMIHYGFIVTANTFDYKQDSDSNIVLAETVRNHNGGRNLGDWSSRVTFMNQNAVAADYPLNSTAGTGATDTTTLDAANGYNGQDVANGAVTALDIS